MVRDAAAVKLAQPDTEAEAAAAAAAAATAAVVSRGGAGRWAEHRVTISAFSSFVASAVGACRTARPTYASYITDDD